MRYSGSSIYISITVDRECLCMEMKVYLCCFLTYACSEDVLKNGTVKNVHAYTWKWFCAQHGDPLNMCFYLFINASSNGVARTEPKHRFKVNTHI